MKKISLLLQLFLFCFFQAEANDTAKADHSAKPIRKPDTEEYGLKGKVKQVRADCFRAGKFLNGMRCTDSYNNYSILFDKKGAIIEDSIHSSGLSNERRIRKYDNNGNLKELITYGADIRFGPNKEIYFYDSFGNNVEIVYLNHNLEVIKKLTYKYDNRGYEIEENECVPDGRVWYKHVYERDVNGNRIEELMYEWGSIYYKLTWKNDSNGNDTEQNCFNADETLKSRCYRKYDDKGNLIEEKMRNSDGSLNSKHTFKYQYDAQGNWIKKEEFTDDAPETVILRQIQYYP